MTNNASETTVDQTIPASNGKVATPILEARAVTMAFGGVRALSEVSVSFAAGEICGLIGPNGAGKTTLFDCLTGIRRPTSGSIHYGGEEVTGRSATWFARQGMRRTFQRQQIFGWLPVEDNVLVALEWRGGGGGLAADLLSLPSRR
jgi:branched-chain amino acid transport system ATP-binding protein